MITKAIGRHIRISPTKLRQVAKLLSGNDVETALSKLSVINKRPCVCIEKILKSAISNARVKGFQPQQLYISRINVDKGPVWKRFRAVAFGRAVRIRKGTAHIKIELDLKS